MCLLLGFENREREPFLGCESQKMKFFQGFETKEEKIKQIYSGFCGDIPENLKIGNPKSGHFWGFVTRNVSAVLAPGVFIYLQVVPKG